MRIAMACEGFAPDTGGAAGWSGQVARGLARRGHEVVVLTFASRNREIGDGAHAPEAGDLDGLVVHRLAWHPSRLARGHAIVAAARRARADVVHDSGVGWSFDVFHPQMGSRLLNYRRDMESRAPGERLRTRLRPRHWRWLHELFAVERRQFSRRDALLVAVSTMVARSFESIHGVPADAIVRIPNGIDVAVPPVAERERLRAEQRRRLGVADDEALFLFPARNLRLKGAMTLVEAAALLRARRARAKIAIIGGDPDAALLRHIASLGLDGTVLRCGSVPHTAPHFSAADALVLPTYHDACSLSVFEAFGFGLPVVTTRRNGASEHVTEGRDGFVLEDPGNAAALAGRMLALTDAGLRRRMSTAAVGLAARHGLARNLDALEGVLVEAAERRARRRAPATGAGA